MKHQSINENKTYVPSAAKMKKFFASAKSSGNVSHSELEQLMPSDVTSDQTRSEVIKMLIGMGVRIADTPVNTTAPVAQDSRASSDFKHYTGQQKLTTKEKNAWEQIMIKSTNDSVVEPLLTAAFADNYISSKNFGVLAKNINFPFWVAGKYLANAGVRVEEPEVIKKNQSQLYNKSDR